MDAKQSPRRSAVISAIVSLLWLSLAGSQLSAAEVSYDLASRYPHVWRGITLREFPVFSAAATITHGSGFGSSFWLGMDLSDERGQGGEIQEINIDLFYRRKLGPVDLKTGYLELIFPGGISNTGEAYLHMTSETLLSPSLEINYNVDLLRDYFLLFHLGESWATSSRSQLSMRGTVAYAGEEFAKFFGASRAGWHHWAATCDLDLPLGRGSLKLRMAYTETLNQAVLADQPVNLWGGIYFSFTP